MHLPPSLRIRRAVPMLLSAALILPACDGSTAPPVDEGPQEILFVSNRDGGPDQYDIYRANADGTDVVRLTDESANYYTSLSLSPDGEHIAFYSSRAPCLNIWVMGIDGSDPTQLTGVTPGVQERCNYHPRWSPDGSRIAFSTTRENGGATWAVYVMNADGHDPRNVSTPIGQDGESAYNIPLGWSPDGRVVFHRYRSSTDARPYIVDADGSGLEPLFEEPDRQEPAWSPDGALIAFISVQDGTSALHVMNADGSGIRRLTDHGGRDWLPGAVMSAYGSDYDPWSPDGSMIAFNHVTGGTSEIFVVNADGSGLRQLTDAGGLSLFNGWSPDGSRIAFSQDLGTGGEIYTINPDGTGLVNVTASDADDSDAIWLP